LEITLLKEKEHAAQMQLEVLKSQIDPHFMFNNFSILSELIVEDTALAEKFLDNLSKVYRYVIQNLKRDTVSIEEEIAFLHSYIYLIKMRYEDAVCIDIDEALKAKWTGRYLPFAYNYWWKTPLSTTVHRLDTLSRYAFSVKKMIL